MSKTQFPEMLTKKWDIAQRISEECNDKRFKWEKQEDESYKLAGLPENVSVIYQDAKDEKNAKGFRLVKGRKTLISTMDVGKLLRELKPLMREVIEPVQQEA